jgi:hypothetical protein
MDFGKTKRTAARERSHVHKRAIFFMNRQNEIDRAMKSVPIIFFEQTGTTESRQCGGRRIV